MTPYYVAADYKLYREKSLDHARNFIELNPCVSKSTQYFTEDEVGKPLHKGTAIKVTVEYVPLAELESFLEEGITP
jgi:hypothetical protein